MTKLTNAKPIRIDSATQANIDIIISSGIAANTSAAFRAGVAALARGLVADPRVWEVTIHGHRVESPFATRDGAIAWLQALGAQEDRQGDWYILDEDGDPTWYTIEAITLQ